MKTSHKDEKMNLLKKIRLLYWRWKLRRSIISLNKATAEKIRNTKLRIWIERNPEIHLFNFWILKQTRRKEWMNIK